MRLSELLDVRVVDSAGERIGVIRDVRVGREPPFPIAGLVLGRAGVLDHAAHAWGFAMGRAAGPWPLRRLTRNAVREARFVPVELVSAWAPEAITLRVRSSELERLEDAQL